MKGRVIALDTVAGRSAAAMLLDGRLDDLILAPPEGAPPGPGAVLRGIVERPMKGQGGVMLRLPHGNGFLRDAKGLRPGTAVLVQVTGHAAADKAVALTARVLFKARFAIVTPGAPGLNVSRQIRDEATRADLAVLAETGMAGSDLGLILRSAAAGADPQAVAEDIRALRAVAEAVLTDAGGAAPELLLDAPDPRELAWREWPSPDLLDEDPGAFARHGVEEALAGLADPRVPLPGGGSLIVEPTAAMVAVDVNTGGDTSPAAGLKANLAAARELPRQLRCRGLGGQVVIDAAPMPKKDRRSFDAALRTALRADPVETAVLGWTALGHVELQRKRERLPLDASVTA